VIATYIPMSVFAADAPAKLQPMPDAFIRIAPDNTVTVMIKHLDKGQGVTTGLRTIVAEELDAEWGQMRAEFAPADVTLYKNLAFGIQGTGGSTSIANSWMQLRPAAAAAREMLVTAAAAQWNVPASEITIQAGVVEHKPSGKTSEFGALAASAARLQVPQSPTLKDPKDFRLIGSRAVHRLDTPDKIIGKTIYAMDVKRPNMVYAMLARAPKFGGTVKSVDLSAAKARAGVVDVVQVPMGVAVLGTTTWAAKQERDAPEDRVGLRQSRSATERRYTCRLQGPRASARPAGVDEGKHRSSSGNRGQGYRSGVRVSLPCPRTDGAAQLRG
jgi:isoquinoline 1-oxidoreductase subunit beta